MIVSSSKPDSDTAEYVHVGGGARNAQVATAIELHVFANCIGQAKIHRSDPNRAAFHAQAAEKFKIALKFPDQRVSECHRLDKFDVVGPAHFVPEEAQAGIHS